MNITDASILKDDSFTEISEVPKSHSIVVDYITPEIPSKFLPKDFLNFMYPAMNRKIFRDLDTLQLSTLSLLQPVLVKGHFMLAPYVSEDQMQQGEGIEYIYSAFDIYMELIIKSGWSHERDSLLNIRTAIALTRLPVEIFRKYFEDRPVICWWAVAVTKFNGLSFAVPMVRARFNRVTGKDEVIFRWYRFQRINFRTPIVSIYR